MGKFLIDCKLVRTILYLVSHISQLRHICNNYLHIYAPYMQQLSPYMQKNREKPWRVRHIWRIYAKTLKIYNYNILARRNPKPLLTIISGRRSLRSATRQKSASSIPTTTTIHTEGASRRPLWIISRAILIILSIIPILTPFPYITTHII